MQRFGLAGTSCEHGLSFSDSTSASITPMFPAARLTDMHVCPMVTPGLPPIPHVGGPISGPCALRTLVAGLPAARVGDMAVCVGPVDSIVLGSFVCFIEGKPAARVTDKCAHGGIIVAGCPTVLIGNQGGAGSPQGGTMSAARAAGAAFVDCGCDAKASVTTNDDGVASSAAAAVVRAGPPATAAVTRTWIEVEVFGEDGTPMAGERVRVIDEDGHEHEGCVDAQGVLRISNIAPGSARITLPDLDQDVWWPA